MIEVWDDHSDQYLLINPEHVVSIRKISTNAYDLLMVQGPAIRITEEAHLDLAFVLNDMLAKKA